MRCQGVTLVTGLTVVALLTWRMSNNFFDTDESLRAPIVITTSAAKCNFPNCSTDSYTISIRSGAANIVGPQICFDGKIIMSHVLNNVGPGLNIVVINGDNGTVEKLGYLNMINGDPAQILDYLHGIGPGNIVLLASYDDVTTKMSDAIRQALATMGSSLINSVKHRDSWVLAGRVGKKSLFEKRVANAGNTNVFEGWPEAAEVKGCFPKNVQPTDGEMAKV